jgi:hypothetical protein
VGQNIGKNRLQKFINRLALAEPSCLHNGITKLSLSYAEPEETKGVEKMDKRFLQFAALQFYFFIG